MRFVYSMRRSVADGSYSLRFRMWRLTMNGCRLRRRRGPRLKLCINCCIARCWRRCCFGREGYHDYRWDGVGLSMFCLRLGLVIVLTAFVWIQTRRRSHLTNSRNQVNLSSPQLTNGNLQNKV